jgi:two-component system response regulator AtoC
LLIIDDDADIVAAIRMALEDQEYVTLTVSHSNSVLDGLEQAEVLRPDIIILDLHMPDKSGFDFMDAIRHNKLQEKLKVIMLTADNSVQNVLTADDKNIKPYRFLGKPFNITDLQAAVYEAAGLAG